MYKPHKTSIACLASSLALVMGCSLDVEVKDAPDMRGTPDSPSSTPSQIRLDLMAGGCKAVGELAGTYSVSQEGLGIKIQYPNCTGSGGIVSRAATVSAVECTLPYPEGLKQILASAAAYVRVEESYWLPNVQLPAAMGQPMGSFGSQGRIRFKETNVYSIPGVRASDLSTVPTAATPSPESFSTVLQLPRPAGEVATGMLSVIFDTHSSCQLMSASPLDLVPARPEWVIKGITLSASPKFD